MSDTPATPKLPDLAKSRFGPISPAEQKLFEAAADGNDADCTSLSQSDRIIHADRLLWLCTDPDASALVRYRGVSIIRAEIDGEVDLEWAKISFPLRIRWCVFKNAIILRSGRLFTLDLLGTSIKDLTAEGLVVEHSVVLSDGFTAHGEVDLTAAKIGGFLNCSGGNFVGKGEAPALNLSGAHIEGYVFLRRGDDRDFEAEGGVNLTAAKIEGGLDCSGGHFVGKCSVPALSALFMISSTTELPRMRTCSSAGFICSRKNRSCLNHTSN